jgi:hypothetical protein
LGTTRCCCCSRCYPDLRNDCQHRSTIVWAVHFSDHWHRWNYYRILVRTALRPNDSNEPIVGPPERAETQWLGQVNALLAHEALQPQPWPFLSDVAEPINCGGELPAQRTEGRSRDGPHPERKIARVSTGFTAPRRAELGRATRFSSLVAAPAMGVLSEIDSRAPCYPAFPQLALIREWHKDGVNRRPPIYAAPCGSSGTMIYMRS